MKPNHISHWKSGNLSRQQMVTMVNAKLTQQQLTGMRMDTCHNNMMRSKKMDISSWHSLADIGTCDADTQCLACSHYIMRRLACRAVAPSGSGAATQGFVPSLEAGMNEQWQLLD